MVNKYIFSIWFGVFCYGFGEPIDSEASKVKCVRVFKHPEAPELLFWGIQERPKEKQDYVFTSSSTRITRKSGGFEISRLLVAVVYCCMKVRNTTFLLECPKCPKS